MVMVGADLGLGHLGARRELREGVRVTDTHCVRAAVVVVAADERGVLVARQRHAGALPGVARRAGADEL